MLGEAEGHLMAIQALIFDVDGTLAETEEAHRAAFNRTFAAVGLDWDWTEELYRDLLRVAGGKERMAHYASRQGFTLPDAGDRSIATLHARKTATYNAIVRDGGVGLRPGVAELIAEARQAGLALAIATTTSLENVRSLVEVTLGGSLADHFDVVAAGDMVPAKKPAPDVYLLALAGLSVPAEQAVAFEDSAIGLAAARAAGIETIVAPSRYTKHDDFRGALAVVPDLTAPLADGRRLGIAGMSDLFSASHLHTPRFAPSAPTSAPHPGPAR
jgi:HAD superfamily hydrolase (TIGR01509 family)